MLFWLFACRPDPGLPDYSLGTTDSGDTGTTDGSLAGPDPYQEGENRLSIGIFYEGGYSELHEINNVDSHFYIWEDTMVMTPTDEYIEGLYADEVVVGGVGWFGGGVFWNLPEDLSPWTTMHVSFQSPSPDMQATEIGMGQTEASGPTFISIEDYGFTVDGEWHHIQVPLATAFPDIDLSSVQMPFNLRADPATEGSILRIDNLYFTDDPVDPTDTNIPEEDPPLEGPDPYQDGELRLSLGAFYEGGYSEVVEINETDTHLYIWSNSMSIGESDDRIEGQLSDEILIGSLGWWGGGIYWDEPRDLSTWTHFNISVKSTSADVTEFEIGMGEGDNGLQEWVDLTTLGFQPDGEWHHISIEIPSTFATLDRTAMQMPMNMRGTGGSGSQIWIDNVYLTVEGSQ